MRLIVGWDGSGHAIETLKSVAPMFREQSIEYVRIVLMEWPPKRTAMWSDIEQRAFLVDDLHRAASEVTVAAGTQLRDVFQTLSRAVEVELSHGDTAETIIDAAKKVRATQMFLVIGPHDPDGTVAQTVVRLIQKSTIPILMLHAAG